MYPLWISKLLEDTFSGQNLGEMVMSLGLLQMSLRCLSEASVKLPGSSWIEISSSSSVAVL